MALTEDEGQQPKVEYLLDACVMRGSKWSLLAQAVAAGELLAVSPVTFWELISHLDEGGHYGYLKARGWFLRAKGFALLEHPHVEYMDSIGAGAIVPADGLLERDCAGALVSSLAQAATLEELYQGAFHDKTGELRTLNGCAAAARAELQKLRSKHVARMSGIKDALRGAPAAALTEEGLADWLEREVARMRIEEERAGHSVSPQRMFALVALHLGHALALSVSPASPKGNDYQDSRLLLHIHLDGARVLVTEDKPFREALVASERLVNLVAARLELPSSPLPVMSKIQFEERMSARSREGTDR